MTGARKKCVILKILASLHHVVQISVTNKQNVVGEYIFLCIYLYMSELETILIGIFRRLTN